MSIDETRHIGIEFELRIQTMIPETEFAAKLDTETIYSYLNLFLDKLIYDLYRTIDKVPVSHDETYLETLLTDMMVKKELTPSSTRPICRCELPDDFGLYIRSYSNVSDTYRLKVDSNKTKSAGTIPNLLISIKDVNSVISRPLDSMKIIRQPIVWLADENGLGALYDRYTDPISIVLEYYRVPRYMDLMTSTSCELPIEMFDLLVSGAVDLYVQYVAGAEARKRLMQELMQELLKQQRSNENE